MDVESVLGGGGLDNSELLEMGSRSEFSLSPSENGTSLGWTSGRFFEIAYNIFVAENCAGLVQRCFGGFKK